VSHLLSLHLRDFRNFAEQRLSVPRVGLALIGDNGQGKTNLLEAIYYLQIFRSFRGAPDEQLVRFGEEVFRVAARVERSGAEREVAAAYDRRRRLKKVTLDGAEPTRLGDAIGRVGAVIFSPADVAIVAGAPGERRRYLDIVLSLTVPGYLPALQRYRQVLAQRNSLLRAGAHEAQVTVWNRGLAAAGSRVTAARRTWVDDRRDAFARRVLAISGGTAGELDYEPSVGFAAREGIPPAIEEIAAAFEEELERSAEREMRRGMTLVGPHRDDLRLRAQREGSPDQWVDLRTYGSGGQQRTAAVALRMIEAETLRECDGEEPIILLDDVFAELDPGRSRRILEWVRDEEGGQVILTAPKPSDFEVREGVLPPWSIRSGVLAPL
jgi:DNA replication and repair protein RecF